jgi:hypothetical protein
MRRLSRTVTIQIFVKVNIDSQYRRRGSGHDMLARYRVYSPNNVQMHVTLTNPISTRSVAQ